MIRYNTSDIVKRATQLADLENSSFITWNENISRINDAYGQLYQTIVDHNDKYFYKTVDIASPTGGNGSYSTSYALPSDFHQLASIYTYPDCSPILRKISTESQTASRYDIVNGNLVIYGNPPSRIRMDYWPVPDTLTYPAEKVAITPSYTPLLDCNDSKLLYVNSTGVGLYDISTDVSSVVLSTLTSATHGWVGRRNIIIQNGTDYFIIDRLTRASVTKTGIVPMKRDGEVYILSGNEIQKPIYSSSAWSYVTVGSVAATISATFATFDDSYIYTTDGTAVKYWSLTGTTSSVVATTPSIVMESYLGTLYMVDSLGRLVSWNNGTSTVISDKDVNTIVGINKVDPDTGYGYTAIDNDGSYYVKSCFVDTELDYPDNFYYSYLAYMLAIQYKNKQCADSTALQSEAASAERKYYDTLNRDVAQYYRIQNIYTGSTLY